MDNLVDTLENYIQDSSDNNFLPNVELSAESTHDMRGHEVFENYKLHPSK